MDITRIMRLKDTHIEILFKIGTFFDWPEKSFEKNDRFCDENQNEYGTQKSQKR